MNIKLITGLFFSLLLSACASNRQVDEQVQEHNDPLESVNRSVWEFNWEVLDQHVLRPVTVAYVDYTPEVVRDGLHNAARNLDEPANLLNNLLQGKVNDSFVSLGRFAINSTFGIFGVFDFASDMGLERKREDFGQTLGKAGAGTGAYLMLPGLGPSDVRSFTGDVVDSSYWPVADLNIYFAVFSRAIKALEGRASLMAQEQLIYDSLDSYTFVKDVYFQDLAHKVTDGKVEEPEMTEEDAELDALLEEF
ncbi:MlaA family lipoprotein [Planctobacterium marinum]|uniref:ABC transporter n=1 Tax=Planctobacterium marinum TaxID=1631968 RepID=A0AA48HJR1_9ALTE|nr:ABC transporter [Planctobacterium marinum]